MIRIGRATRRRSAPRSTGCCAASSRPEADATSRPWPLRRGSRAQGSTRRAIGPGPYQHLAEEFERRLATLREAGEIPDPREAQIGRLKELIEHQRGRNAALEAQVAELVASKQSAVSRLAAQHEEVLRLRQVAAADNVTPLRRL